MPVRLTLRKGDTSVEEAWNTIATPVLALMEKRAMDQKRCLEASVRKLSRQLVLHLQDKGGGTKGEKVEKSFKSGKGKKKHKFQFKKLQG